MQSGGRDTNTQREMFILYFIHRRLPLSISSIASHREICGPNKFPKACVEKLMCTTVSAVTEMRCEWGSYSDADRIGTELN